MKLITEKGEVALPENFSFTIEKESPFHGDSGTASIPVTLPVSQQTFNKLERPERLGRSTTYVRKLKAKLEAGIIHKDGVLVIWHDPTLERNTDGKGRIEDHTLAELRTYDAGYTFTRDGGRSYPFRGKGVRICTLSEALEACPDQRFNIDLKTKCPEIVDQFIRVIRDHGARDRVVGASFHLSNLKRLRALAPDFLTSITTMEVVPLLLRQKTHTLPSRFGKKIIFQVPRQASFIKVVTPSFVREMHRRGLDESTAWESAYNGRGPW